jgi:hypothetical protein
MMNMKNHEEYSDKFILRVLNLNILENEAQTCSFLEDEAAVKEPTELYNC